MVEKKDKLDIFEQRAQETAKASKPLAERMRPKNLEEFIGQKYIVGKGGIIRNAIEKDQIFSMLLWGPPGCGKTTIARIIAVKTSSYFVHFSAVLSGIREIRSIIEKAKNQQRLYRKKTILFVDEIHRFNKAQQDVFLHHVERGLITLIGATTENPSFEVIPPLLSRCRVIVLNFFTEDDIYAILDRAIKDRARGLGNLNLVFSEDALAYLIQIADGDARTALNNLEIVSSLLLVKNNISDDVKKKHITIKELEFILQKKSLVYDKSGEEHYNLISAFHKSLRGSDPDAALYWLERMLSAGEDPLYLARRMVRFASEDIGISDPNAIGVALNAMEAFKFLGKPEGELALAQSAIYLAAAPKSNSIYLASEKVKTTIKNTGTLPVPLHIRNAPTALMKKLGYGKDYKYAHNFKNAYIHQRYLPERLLNQQYYFPTDRGYEKTIKQRLEKLHDIKKQE